MQSITGELIATIKRSANCYVWRLYVKPLTEKGTFLANKLPAENHGSLFGNQVQLYCI